MYMYKTDGYMRRYGESQKIYDLEEALDNYQPIAGKHLGTGPMKW